jgi:hypothetical protein
MNFYFENLFNFLHPRECYSNKDAIIFQISKKEQTQITPNQNETPKTIKTDDKNSSKSKAKAKQKKPRLKYDLGPSINCGC